MGSSLQGLLVVVCVSPLSLAGGSCHVPVMQKKSLVTEEHLSSICLQWFLPAREDITDREVFNSRPSLVMGQYLHRRDFEGGSGHRTGESGALGS